MTNNAVIALATCAGVIVAFLAVVVAWVQLSKLRSGVKINSLMAVLEMESQMLARKEKIDSISSEIRKLDIEDSGRAKLLAEVYSDQLGAALENYLNIFDRLCFCILRDYFPERDWITEFRTMLHRTIEENPDEFAAGTPYRNMFDLDNEWQRK